MSKGSSRRRRRKMPRPSVRTYDGAQFMVPWMQAGVAGRTVCGEAGATVLGMCLLQGCGRKDGVR